MPVASRPIKTSDLLNLEIQFKSKLKPDSSLENLKGLTRISQSELRTEAK